MSPLRLRSVTLGLLGVGAAGTLALLVYGSGLSGLLHGDFVVALWSLAPYVLLGFGTARFWSREARTAGLVGAAIAVVGGLALYVDGGALATDGVGAFAFATVPLMQAVVAGASIGTAFLLPRRAAA